MMTMKYITYVGTDDITVSSTTTTSVVMRSVNLNFSFITNSSNDDLFLEY